PVDAVRRQLSWETGRSGAGAVYRRCLVPRWEVDVLFHEYWQRVSYLAATLSGRCTPAGHLWGHAGRGDRIRSRRPLLRYFDRHQSEYVVDPRLARRSADHFGRFRFFSFHLSRQQETLLPGSRRRGAEHCERRTLGRGFGIRAAPSAVARLS